MDKAEKLDVEASRTKRLERVKAKQRDRGGIFKPSESNPLIDILLSRNFPAKSPAKPRLSKAGKLLSSRKSLGVPKTPRKSLSHASSSRKSLKVQENVDNSNDATKGKADKASKAKKPRKSTAQSSATKSTLSNLDTSATAEEDVETSEAGPSFPRKESAILSSRPVGKVSQKHSRTGEADEEEIPNQEPNSKKPPRSKRVLGGTQTKPKQKPKTKSDARSKTVTSKGKGKQVAIACDDYGEKLARTQSAPSSNSREGKKDREDGGSSKDGSLPRTSRKKSKKDSENSGPSPSPSEKEIETKPEEDESEQVSERKEPKRRLEEDELNQRTSKKARVKDVPDKKKVTFAKSPKKSNKVKGKTKRNQIFEKERKEIAHKKNAETSSSSSKASSSIILGKTKDVEFTPPEVGYTKLEEPPEETISVAKSNKPPSSSKAKDVPLTSLLKNKIQSNDSAYHSTQHKPPPSLSARPMSKKPDMSFKMRSVSYPSTLLGSPLKAFDSERDPLDLL